MTTRAETTAATREALLDAAGTLLDAGGPDAVTLREVGARAGVSRSAPYRHFAGKETMLTELVTRAWTEIGDSLSELQRRPGLSPRERVHDAYATFITLGQAHPYLYQLMFGTPALEPNEAISAAARAAEHSLDLLLEIVEGVVGGPRRSEYAALLMASVHGIASLEISGHLTEEKWHTDTARLIDLLVGLLPSRHNRPDLLPAGDRLQPRVAHVAFNGSGSAPTGEIPLLRHEEPEASKTLEAFPGFQA